MDRKLDIWLLKPLLLELRFILLALSLLRAPVPAPVPVLALDFLVLEAALLPPPLCHLLAQVPHRQQVQADQFLQAPQCLNRLPFWIARIHFRSFGCLAASPLECHGLFFYVQ
jgi:hypothetical protein